MDESEWWAVKQWMTDAEWAEFKAKLETTETGRELMNEGTSIGATWTKLAYQKPPDDWFGKLIHTAGVIGQVLLSWATFPAAMGAFLMEEAMQTAGMGAYMLATGREWKLLQAYLPNYKLMIDTGRAAAWTLSLINPITGGAVVIYSEAAEMSYKAFKDRADREVEKEALASAEKSKYIEFQNAHGTLRLSSIPSSAEIWMNNRNMELITPETFKELDVGPYDITLRKYNVSRETWDILSFTVEIEPGRRKEIHARIPPDISTTPDGEEPEGTTDTPQLPDFIKAEVTGDYAIDGDTFITTTGERVRVLAIDAPEIGRPWADVSKEAMGLLIEDKNISLRIQGHKPLDQYGRTLAICSSYKGNIAVFQLSSGLARVAEFEDDIFDYSKYYNAEQVAHDRKIGIWS